MVGIYSQQSENPFEEEEYGDTSDLITQEDWSVVAHSPFARMILRRHCAQLDRHRKLFRR